MQIELGGKVQKTKAKEGKLNPEWNETFEFEAFEGDEVINYLLTIEPTQSILSVDT